MGCGALGFRDLAPEIVLKTGHSAAANCNIHVGARGGRVRGGRGDLCDAVVVVRIFGAHRIFERSQRVEDIIYVDNIGVGI